MIRRPPFSPRIVSGVLHRLFNLVVMGRSTYRSRHRLNQLPRRRHPLVRSPLPKEARGYVLTKSPTLSGGARQSTKQQPLVRRHQLDDPGRLYGVIPFILAFSLQRYEPAWPPPSSGPRLAGVRTLEFYRRPGSQFSTLFR